MSRRSVAVAAFLLLAAGLRWLGFGPVDAVVLAVPPLLPQWLATMPAKRRRRALVIELPVLALLAVAVGIGMAAGNARVLEAPLPWRSALAFGGYVLAWVLTLRVANDGILGLLQRGLPERPGLCSATLGIAIVALGMPQLYVALQTHRIAVAQTPTPSASGASGSAHETVTFCSSDGVRLHGTLLRQPGPAPVVVVCHGLGANRAAFFGLAELAGELGCHALAFDFRAHGDSDGWVSTFGALEVHDVIAAVAWLRTDPQLTGSPVVLAGVSMGAATALRAAAAVGAVAVFAESSFADLPAMVATQAARLGPVAHLFTAGVDFAARCQLGIDLASVSPRASLAALSASVRVELVHAGDDDVIPVAEGERLAAARDGLQLHVFAGAPHGGCYGADPRRYRQLLQALLRR